MSQMRIEVRTPELKEDTFWVHKIPIATDLRDVMVAVGTLYEDVIEIHIYIEQEDEDE